LKNTFAIIKRTLKFAGKLHHYLPEYLIYTILGIFLGLVNIALLIPVLRVLFENQITNIDKPALVYNIGYIIEYFNYWINNAMTNYGKLYGLSIIALVIGASSLLANLFRYLATKTLIRFRLYIMQDIRNKLFKQYLNSDISFFQKNSRSTLVNTLTNEVYELEHSLLGAYQVIMRDPLVIFFYFCALFYMSFQLTLFAVFFFPVAGFIISRVIKKLKSYGYFSQAYASKILAKVDESVSNIKIIKSFDAMDKTINEFEEINQSFTQASKKLFVKRELAAPASEFMGVCAVLGLVLFGGYLIFDKKTTLDGAMFIGYIALFIQMIQPFKNIASSSSSIQRGIVSAEKLFSLLDEQPQIVAKKPVLSNASITNSFSFNNVSFSYQEDDEIIKGISFNLLKGEKLALVGESGAGKSTIADLCSRFYDVSSGEILIDNINIKHIALSNLRQMIGIVTQEPILFFDTIYENIKYNTNAIEQEVIDAAKNANAHDFIMQLPQKYQTIVGDRGNRLSGGQKQRITIARAILKNPQLLILDEATSALDTESEKAVQDALENLMTSRTSIIIAHRLSTVKNCDKIIVLKQGEIVEYGTHTGLIEKNGYYKKLVSLQQLID